MTETINLLQTGNDYVKAFIDRLNGVGGAAHWRVSTVLGAPAYDAFHAAAAVMRRSVGRLDYDHKEDIKESLQHALDVIAEELGVSLRNIEPRPVEAEWQLELLLDHIAELQRIIAYGSVSDFAIRFWALYR